MMIICPHCKLGARHSVSHIEDAIRENEPIVCVACGEQFGLVTVCLTRVAEQRDGADLAQHTCPSCAGLGKLLDDDQFVFDCPACKGTGQV